MAGVGNSAEIIATNSSVPRPVPAALLGRVFGAVVRQPESAAASPTSPGLHSSLQVDGHRDLDESTGSAGRAGIRAASTRCSSGRWCFWLWSALWSYCVSSA